MSPTFGPAERDRFIAMGIRAQSLFDEGRFAEAAEMYGPVHAQLVALKGIDDAETLAIQLYIAQALQMSGDIEQAEALFFDAERRFHKTLGAEHLDTIVTGHHVVQVLAQLRRFEEALQWLDALNERCARALDPNHRVAVRIAAERQMLRLGLLGFDGLSLDEYLATFDHVLQHERFAEAGGLIETLIQSDKGLAVIALLLESGRPAEAAQMFVGLSMSQWSAADDQARPRSRITVLTRIARLREAQGDWPRALVVRQCTLAVLQLYAGKKNPNTLAISQAELDCATVHGALGDIDAAHQLRRLAVERLRANVGIADPATLKAMSALARTLEDRGDASGACALHEQVLAGCTDLSGADHPQVIANEALLAQALLSNGEAGRAVALLETRARWFADAGAEADLELIRAGLFIATLLRSAGRYEQTRELQERLIERLASVLGDEHREVLQERRTLSHSLVALGDSAGARALLQQVYGASRLRLPRGDLDIIKCGLALAKVLVDQGAPMDEVLALQEELMDDGSAALPPDHPWMQSVRAGIATSLAALGRLDEARSMAEALLALHAEGSPDDSVVMSARETLATVLASQGRMDEAGAMLEQAVEASARLLGPEVQLTLELRTKLAVHRFKQGRLEESRLLLEELVGTRHQGTGQVSLAMGYLGSVLFHMGELTASAARFSEVLQAVADGHRPRDRSIVAAEAAEMLLRLDAQRPGEIVRPERVLDLLAAVSLRLQTELELRDLSVVALPREEYVRLHRAWLVACLRWAPERCVAPLVALHGFEAWPVALGEALESDSERSMGGAEKAFVEARRAIAQIRNEHAQVQGRIRDLLGRDLPAGQESGNALRDTELRSLEALRRECAERERHALEPFTRARARLRESNSAVGTLMLRPTPAELVRRTNIGDQGAIAVLFESSELLYGLILTGEAGAMVTPLPRLPELRDQVRRYLGKAASGSRAAGTRGVLAAQAPLDANKDSSTIDSLEALGDEALWSRLGGVAPHVRRWHIVTGPGLHDMPLELGRGSLEASFHCGLPALLRRSAGSPTPHDAALSVTMAADRASQSGAPLPFVEAEADAIAAVLASAGAGFVRRDGAALLSLEQAAADAVQIACHGRVERAGTDSAHGTLLLDHDRGVVLHPARVGQLPRGLREVVATACVGGLTGHADTGDALGLAAALGLRGAQLVGCLEPVPDLLMPIFSALYWHSRAAERVPPHVALERVRARLRSGDWPAAVVDALWSVYARHLDSVLKEVSSLIDDPQGPPALALARSVRGWLPRGELPAVDVLALAQQHCRSDRVRQALVTRVLARLIDNRRSPDTTMRRQMAHLCAFTMCWG